MVRRQRLLLTALALAAGSAAQEEAPAPAPAQDTVSPAEPTKDLFDLLRELRHKPPPPPPGPDDYKKWMVAAAPVLTYGPTSGFGIGVAGNMAVYRGFPDTTRISSIVASVTATTKEQVLVNAKINSSALDNRWHFEGDNRLYWTSQKTYGLGTDTAEGAAVDQKYDYFRFYETLYRKVARHAYLGAGFLYSNHRDVRPADDEAEAAWPSSPYVAVLRAARVRPGVADLGRRQPERALRQPRRPDQPEPGLVRERHLPGVLRGLPGRRVRAGSSSATTPGPTSG